jgi:rhomboid family GlyGly-CTERM serine protease
MFALIIVVLNFPLIHGRFAQSLIFLSEPVRAGEWWRVLAHPFVHVSWYHLFLDATAFLMLYHGLEQRSVHRRLSYVAISGAGSLLVSLWANPMTFSSGLCGLSGVAHGLMAISGLEMMTSRSRSKVPKLTGVLCFSLAVLKSGLEAIAGQALFTSLHFGMLGTPIAVCHAGGVIGGMIGFLVAQICNLLYRRIAFCRSPGVPERWNVSPQSRSQSGDTAECNSALRHSALK